MARTLRLGFAMGGGVSLGTFSGAALSQAIKLALLRGCYGPPDALRAYDRVEIDVFSGTSAGAMALALMLRWCVHQTDEQRALASGELESEFGAEFSSLEGADPWRHRCLIAAQVVQDIQRRVWCREITLDGLLGNGPAGRRDLKYAASILDRGEVDRLASEFLCFSGEALTPEGLARLDEKSDLLADRVLFACSLSNLTGIQMDARPELSAYKNGYIGLGDGGRSVSHRELRVFDLNFAPVRPGVLGNTERHPARWCRYHNGDEVPGGIGDLRNHGAWAKMAATAVACGAFPFAFEPVVLRRSQYEFGNTWPRNLPRAPEPFDPATDTIPKYPFTYIDGGVFNNEPIREAFRLGSFIDAMHPGDFDRRIIFVDPFVDPGEPGFRLGVHRQYGFSRVNFLSNDLDLVRRTSLGRLIPAGASTIRAVFDEARIIEADRVYKTRNKFALRNALRAGLAWTTVVPEMRNGAIKNVIAFCDSILADDAADSQIPPGRLSTDGELERVIAEDASLAALAGRGAAFCASGAPGDDPDAESWYRALVYVVVDLALDLTGKNEDGRLIAIAPFYGLPDAADPDRVPVAIKLWGGEVQGFADFASLASRGHEVRAGAYCAQLFLECCGLIKGRPLPPVPALSDDERAEFMRDLERGMGALGERIDHMVEQSGLVRVFPGIDQAVLASIGAWLEGKVKALGACKPPSAEYEFRISVPGPEFELDGKGLWDHDLRPIPDPSGPGLVLVTFARYTPETGLWSGPHVDEGQQMIRVDRNLRTGTFCSLALPDLRLMARADLHPSPGFRARVSAEDQGRTLGSERWAVDERDVSSLEDTIFGG